MFTSALAMPSSPTSPAFLAFSFIFRLTFFSLFLLVLFSLSASSLPSFLFLLSSSALSFFRCFSLNTNLRFLFGLHFLLFLSLSSTTIAALVMESWGFCFEELCARIVFTRQGTSNPLALVFRHDRIVSPLTAILSIPAFMSPNAGVEK